MIVSAQRMRSRAENTEEIVEALQKSLEESAFRVLRTVSFHYERGVLFLRGQLPTYFHKQLAQEAVRRIGGVARIVNQIEVPLEHFQRTAWGQEPATASITQTIKETAI